MWFFDTQCELDEVKTKLKECKKFGWSWSRDSTEPFRHTGVAVYMDDKPTFTINFSPAEGNRTLDALFQKCDHIITINAAYGVEDNTVKYFPPFEEIIVEGESDKQRAMDLIHCILSFDPGKYQLLFNNCRDHVTGVVEHFVKQRKLVVDLEEFRREINQVKVRDVKVASTFAMVGILAIGVMLQVATVFSRLVVDGPGGEETAEGGESDEDTDK